MARTNVPAIQLVREGGVSCADNDMTALDATNHHVIACDKDDLILLVANTAASQKSVTVKAGDRAAGAWNAGQGDLVVAVANTGRQAIVVERARHMQAGGLIYVDVETGMTGKITALKLPQGGTV